MTSSGLAALLAGGLLVLSGPPARAAAGPWSGVPSGTTATLNDVVVLDPAEGPGAEEELPPVVIAVGDEGTLIRSADGGDSWQTIALPTLADGSLPGLHDLHFPSPSSLTGYAVGGKAQTGAVYRTDDGGLTWRLVQTFATLSLSGVWFTDASTGHAVGRLGTGGAQIVRTTDGGATWTPTFTLATATGLRGIAFSTPEVGVAVGEGGLLAPGTFSGMIVHTTDGGSSWQNGTVADDSRIPGPLQGVAWTASSAGAPAYAVGRVIGAGAVIGGQVWRSGDDGATWEPKLSGSPFQLYDVDFLDENHGQAVGGGANLPLIFETETGGDAWTANPVLSDLNDSNFELRGLAYASAEVRFAVGTGGKVLRYSPEVGPEAIARSIINPTPPEVPPPHDDSKCPSWDPAALPDGKETVFEEGTLERAAGINTQRNTLAVDSSSRLLYEFEQVRVHQDLISSVPSPRVRVWARDLDTLCLRPGPVLEDAADTHTAYGPVAVPVVDEEQGRLFLVYQRGPSELYRRTHPTDADTRLSAVTDLGVAVVGPDPVRPGVITQLASVPFPPGLPPVPHRARAAAGTYFPSQQGPSELSRAKVYLVLDYTGLHSSGNFQPGLGLVFLLQVDVQRLMAGNALAFDWAFPVAGCGRTSNDLTGTERSAIVRTGRYIALACGQGRVGTGSQQGSVGGVARVELDGTANPGAVRFFPIDGARTNQPTLADPVSGRLFLGAITRRGTGLAGFDVERGAWFGVIPDDGRIGMLAVDRRSGRLYMAATGLVVSDARSLDLPQGRLAATEVRSQVAGSSGQVPTVTSVEVTTGDQVEKGDVLVVLRSAGEEVPVTAPHAGRVSLSVAEGDAVAEAGLIAVLRAEAAGQRTETAVDPKNGRLFASDSVTTIKVLRDTLSPVEPAKPFDPDALTRDIPEVEGLTGKTFSGGGQAYGIRARWVNGSRGVTDHSQFCGSPSLPGGFRRPGLSYCPHNGTRELTLAQVPGADLADSEASAKAVGAEHDGAGRQEGTDRDLASLAYAEPDELVLGSGSSAENPDPREQAVDEYHKQKQENAPEQYDRFREGRRANTVPNRWPYRRVSCSDFGGSPQEDVVSEDGAVLTVPTGPNDGDEQKVPATFSSSSVTCDQQAGLVAAGAVFGQEGELGPPDESPFVDVASTRTSVISYRDPDFGFVSRVKAEVTGLRLAHPDQGEISIGLLRTVAETRASGRSSPGAVGSFERHIEDVWVKQASDPEPQRLCEEQCDSKAVIVELNRVFGTRAHFDFPEPDPARIGGTPGGAEAVVTRHPQEQTSDVVTNEEDPGRLEVPGLLVTVYADEATGFSRQIVQLAGVSADSKYGVFCLFGDTPDGCEKAAPPPEFPPPLDPTSVDPESPTPPEGAVTAPDETAVAGDEPEAERLAPRGSGPGRQAAAIAEPKSTEGEPPSIVRRVIEGFRYAWNSLFDALRAAAVWLLVAAPLLLYVRRRWLPAPRAQGGSRS